MKPTLSILLLSLCLSNFLYPSNEMRIVILPLKIENANLLPSYAQRHNSTIYGQECNAIMYVAVPHSLFSLLPPIIRCENLQTLEYAITHSGSLILDPNTTASYILQHPQAKPEAVEMLKKINPNKN